MTNTWIRKNIDKFIFWGFVGFCIGSMIGIPTAIIGLLFGILYGLFVENK